jgi:hypothetical protein
VALERRSYTPAEAIALTTQVEGYCPLCGTALFYKKKGRTYRYYELAHIYPLNPKPAEAEELKDVELLSAEYDKVGEEFESIDQFLLTIDVLYILGQINVDPSTAVVTYAD